MTLPQKKPLRKSMVYLCNVQKLQAKIYWTPLSFINKTKHQSRKLNNSIYAQILMVFLPIGWVYIRVQVQEVGGPKAPINAPYFCTQDCTQAQWLLSQMRSIFLSWNCWDLVGKWFEMALNYQMISGEERKTERSGQQLDSRLWNCLFICWKNQLGDLVPPMFQRNQRIWWESDATSTLTSFFYILNQTLDPSASVNTLVTKFWS